VDDLGHDQRDELGDHLGYDHRRFAHHLW
jgi:hypothetical protein